MAVAAALGGASPNFDGLYSEVSRLAKKLSFASPRELNDPGVTLQLTKPGSPPEVFETYIKAFYGKEGSTITYQLFYKDANNSEIMVSDGQNVMPSVNGFSLNGTTLTTGNILALDQVSGKIICNSTTTTNDPYDPLNANNANVSVGIMKLDAVSGLDVGLLNDRISQVNLIIEALNKVLIVAIGNVDAAINLRL